MGNGKLIIEAFIAYMLSARLDCTCSEIFDIMEKVDGKSSSQSAKERRLRRYIEDFQSIGALKENARIRNLTCGMNGISLEDYSLNLINYSNVQDSLKPLYRIVKILNSECGDNPENDDTISRFVESYFSNGLECDDNSENELLNNINVILDMMSVCEEESRVQKLGNALNILSDIKMHHGYNVK